MARADFAVRAPADGGRPRYARRGQDRPVHVASSPFRLRLLRFSVCELQISTSHHIRVFVPPHLRRYLERRRVWCEASSDRPTA